MGKEKTQTPSKKRKRVLQLNQDTIYEVITYLSPVEVLELKFVSKSWLEVIKNSRYWEMQSLKYFNMDKNVKNYENYFKEKLNFLTTQKEFGYILQKPIQLENLKNTKSIHYPTDLAIEKVKLFQCIFKKILLLEEKNILHCIDIFSKKTLWTKNFKGDTIEQIEYYFLNETVICYSKAKIFSVSLQRGSIIWSRTFDNNISKFMLKGGVIITAETVTNIYGIDVSTGAIIWKIPFKAVNLETPTTGTSVHGKKGLFSFTRDNVIVKFKSFKKIPKMKRVDFRTHYYPYIMKVFDNMIISATGKGEEDDNDDCLYTIDIDTEEGNVLFDDICEIHFSIDILTKNIYLRSNRMIDPLFAKVNIKTSKKYQFKSLLESNSISIDLSTYKMSNILIQEDFIYFLAFEKHVYFCCFKIEKKKDTPYYFKKLDIEIGDEEKVDILINDNEIFILTKQSLFIIK